MMQTEILMPSIQLSQSPIIGDAVVDKDMRSSFSHPPQSYKAVTSELQGYALDTVHIRKEAEGLAPTDIAQKKASDELKSYSILNFEVKTPKHSERHGEGSKYEDRHESKELSSYSNILSFPESDDHEKKSQSLREADGLKSYNNILSFPASSEKFHKQSAAVKLSMSPTLEHVQRSDTKISKKKAIHPAQTTKLFESSYVSNFESQTKKLNPEMPLASDWMKLWNEATRLESKGHTAQQGEVKRIKAALAEVKHAIIKESYDPAETQKFDSSFLRKDLLGLDMKLGQLDKKFVASEKQAKADVLNCQICLRKWSPTALACSLQACHQKLTPDDEEQLRINNDVAAAMKGCVGNLTPETSHVRAVVKNFVLPWTPDDDDRLHSWVEADEASPGLLGLGLESGQTPKLDLGHATYLSAAATHCMHTSQTLEQLLAPLAKRQEELNSRRIKKHGDRDSVPENKEPFSSLSEPRAHQSSRVAAILAWRSNNKRSMLKYSGDKADPWQDFLDSEVANNQPASTVVSSTGPSGSDNTILIDTMVPARHVTPARAERNLRAMHSKVCPCPAALHFS